MTNSNAAQFTGRENDGSGLYYYRARFYHPGLQRFISEDPLGFGGGLNAFAYAGNVPTMFSDPLGLKPCSNFGGGKGRGPGSCAGGTGSGGGKGGGAGSGAGGGDDGGGGGNGRGGGGNGTGDGGADPDRPKCAPSGNAPPPGFYRDLGQSAGWGDNPIYLYQFHRGGFMDAQVLYGGSPAYANYVYGVYMSSAAYPPSFTLAAADGFGALFSDYPSGTTMDPTYTHIPKTYVDNIMQGINDAKSGALCNPY
jgi:RHS repeat-associated protein